MIEMIKNILSSLLLCVILMIPSFCFSATISEEDASVVTTLSKRRTDVGIIKERVDVQPLSLREQIIIKLREAHKNGEYLEITEEDVLRIPSSELEIILTGQDVIQDIHNEINKNPETYYSNEEKEIDFFEYVMEKAAEYKTLAATLSIMVLGAYPAIRKGMDIVNQETDDEAEKRRERFNMAIEPYFEIVESQEIGDEEPMPHVKLKGFRLNPLSEKAKTDDIIATLYERSFYTPPPAQVKQFINELDSLQDEIVDMTQALGQEAYDYYLYIQSVNNMTPNGENILSENELKTLKSLINARVIIPSMMHSTQVSIDEINENIQTNKGAKIITVNEKLQNIIDERNDAELE